MSRVIPSDARRRAGLARDTERTGADRAPTPRPEPAAKAVSRESLLQEIARCRSQLVRKNQLSTRRLVEMRIRQLEDALASG